MTEPKSFVKIIGQNWGTLRTPAGGIVGIEYVFVGIPRGPSTWIVGPEAPVYPLGGLFAYRMAAEFGDEILPDLIRLC